MPRCLASTISGTSFDKDALKSRAWAAALINGFRGVQLHQHPSTAALSTSRTVISPLMWAFELGFFDDRAQAFLLYKLTDLPTGLTTIIAATMNRIIDLWQSATGERVEDLAVTQRKVQMPMRSAQPTKVPPGPMVPPLTAPDAPAAHAAPVTHASAGVPSRNGSHRPVPQV